MTISLYVIIYCFKIINVLIPLRYDIAKFNKLENYLIKMIKQTPRDKE